MNWRNTINVRSFAWHDLLTFYRYRRQVVCTDSSLALTRGSPASPLGFLSRLSPSVGFYTCISTPKDGAAPLIGQMQYASGDRSARIAFLMPDAYLSQPEIGDLVESMAIQAGAWGAFHLLAEVEENSSAMEGLRRSGFSVYAWQRIWKYVPASKQPSNGKAAATKDKTISENGNSCWRPASSVDEVMIRNLYQSLVPPLVQSAEPLSAQRMPGWVYRQEDEILAYVEGIYGPQGIYLQPLIHPGVEDIVPALANLLTYQRAQASRPVYFAVRSYQAWLEPVMRDLAFEVGPRTALMVKHLVLQQRAAQQSSRHSVLEKYTAEPTVPMVHNSTVQK